MPLSTDNVWLIDKPLDWTSFDIVNKIKYALKNNGIKTKIGHAGTLDPKATGLLIICTGKYTKTIESIQNQNKTYTGSFFIGATTPCFDTEQPVDEIFPIEHITEELIDEKRKEFVGAIAQTPPIHSAVKIKGKNAYTYARQGKEVVLQPKIINIYDFEFTRIQIPELDFIVQCSKGTYIRSLANDFGLALGSGGYLLSLRRTKIGEYNVSDAYSIDEMINFIAQNSI
jgi:tRNA pseudouridine55 synthase